MPEIALETISEVRASSISSAVGLYGGNGAERQLVQPGALTWLLCCR